MRSICFSIAFVAMLLCVCPAGAQELFSYTEPASNMPAHSVGIRVSNYLMPEKHTAAGFLMIPEIMYGASKNLMLHAEGFISNRGGIMAADGAGIYAKYRFYSKDGLHRHFRMAAFVRAAVNNKAVPTGEIEINGYNTGAELGLIGTQLLSRQAISATLSLEHVTGNHPDHELPPGNPESAVNYSLSTGRLILPRAYKSYHQTNLNLMAEILGQYDPKQRRSFLDVAPAVQLIFNSQARVDIGYRKQLYSTMQRAGADGLLVRLEYLFF